MSVVISIHKFDYQDVYYHKPVNNNIIANSKFVRTIYSNGLVTLNNICLDIPLAITCVNRNRCFFDRRLNSQVILFLNQVEDNILVRSGIDNKTPRRRLSEQLESGFLKIFTQIDNDYRKYPVLLKISGLWESDSEIGITYKFVFGLPIGNKIGHNGFHNRNENQIQH